MKYVGSNTNANLNNMNQNADTENIMFGVNVHDKEAVKQKMKQIRRRKFFLTLLSLVIIGALGYVIYDFYNVVAKEGTPVFALKENIENGVKYKGISYELIKCNDGKRYLNEMNKTCVVEEKEEVVTFDTIFYNALVTYLKGASIVNDNFKDLKINEYVVDEELNDYEGSDYYVDLTYECNDGSINCFKVLKERTNQSNVELYVSLDKLNVVKEVSTFKTTGKKYAELKETYANNVKEYMISKNMYDDNNVRYFNLELINNKGRYMYGGIMYEDAYEVKLSYMCKDNGNTCITKIDDGNNTNLSFNVIMLLDAEGKVGLLESVKVFYK